MPQKLTMSNTPHRRADNEFRTISIKLSTVQMLSAKLLRISTISQQTQATETRARQYTLKLALSDPASLVHPLSLTNTMLKPPRLKLRRLSMLSASLISSDTPNLQALLPLSRRPSTVSSKTISYSLVSSRVSSQVCTRWRFIHMVIWSMVAPLSDQSTTHSFRIRAIITSISTIDALEILSTSWAASTKQVNTRLETL